MLCTLLLSAFTVQVSARYDCNMTGVRNQKSCCCQGKAQAAAGGAVQTGGCCDVRYHDATVEVTQAGSDTHEQRISEAQQSTVAVLAIQTPQPGLSSYSAPSRDGPPVPSVPPDRFVLFCSFLC